MRNFTQLPVSGDLWMAPEVDKDGNVIPRADTVSVADMPVRAKMTPDVAAILMAEFEAAKTAAKAK